MFRVDFDLKGVIDEIQDVVDETESPDPKGAIFSTSGEAAMQ